MYALNKYVLNTYFVLGPNRPANCSFRNFPRGTSEHLRCYVLCPKCHLSFSIQKIDTDLLGSSSTFLSPFVQTSGEEMPRESHGLETLKDGIAPFETQGGAIVLYLMVGPRDLPIGDNS